ncbi:MAG: plasmid recombination protein [Oscillospiraceae bacterium]|nr:plasmid recombination protein [Oscillospiraceae bacterium]
MPYAILRFKKCKSGGVSACYNHNERKKERYKSNPDIISARNTDNYHLVLPRQTYRREVSRMIRAAGCKTRSNSTVMVETLITASPEFMNALSLAGQRSYFQSALEFMESRVGRENIIAATVHMDEKTPHMHLVFCPITPDKCLSAKKTLGNQAQLSKWQDAYHAHMSQYYPELERGVSAQITKRKHLPVWLFKMAERLDKQFSEVEHILSNTNHFNAKKQSANALECLAKWLPEAEKFTAQMKTMDNHIKSLEQSEKDAKNRAWQAEQTADSRVDTAVSRMQSKLDEKDKALFAAEIKTYDDARKLRCQAAKFEALIGRLPPGIRPPTLESKATVTTLKPFGVIHFGHIIPCFKSCKTVRIWAML